jgi:quercetin dioxygenase-like cupin family protein
MSGEYRFQCGDEHVTASAGSFVFLPQRVPHRYQAGSEGGRLLMIFAPGGIEDYFREVAAAMNDDALDPARAQDIARRFGIDLFDSY